MGPLNICLRSKRFFLTHKEKCNISVFLENLKNVGTRYSSSHMDGFIIHVSHRQTSCTLAFTYLLAFKAKAIKNFVHHKHHYHFHTPNCLTASCLQLL